MCRRQQKSGIVLMYQESNEDYQCVYAIVVSFDSKSTTVISYHSRSLMKGFANQNLSEHLNISTVFEDPATQDTEENSVIP
ncbi:Hephaestin [Manis pentadactyla]|nr:Hephaestin [Manis pentadactyla]